MTMRTRTMQMSAVAAFVVLAVGAGVVQARAQDAQAAPADRADQLLGLAPIRGDLPPEAEPVINDGEAYHRASDERQDPAELRTTQALNDEIVSQNQLVDNQERAERAKYEATAAQSLQDRLAYEAGLRQAEVDAEATQRQWEQDRARWEADVAACQAGNRARCAPPR